MAASSTVKKDVFTFEVDGKSWELPLLGDLRPADMQRFEEDSKPLTALKSVLNQHAPGLFNALPNSQALNDLMESWQKASGITVGESSASADS